MPLGCRVSNCRSALCIAAIACAAGTGGAAAQGSGLTLDLRYRYETVDDDAFSRNANAHTLRARVGYAFSPRLSSSVALADYRSQGFASDERTLWFTVEYHR